MVLKLNKKELGYYKLGLDKIGWSSEVDMLNELEATYNGIKYPAINESYKEWSKEQLFFHFIRTEKILYFYYDRALKEQNPALLLNALYTHNHIESTYELATGYDHCDKFLPVLYCYSGNNYSLVDNYLPLDIGKSKKGHRLPVTVINLILAIRGALEKEEVEKDTLKFLSRKNARIDNTIVKALLAVLREDPKEVSENLDEITLLHKSSKWLNEYKNPISKYLPFISYGIYSLMYKHKGLYFLKEIELNESNIWWDAFQKFNMEHEFKEGINVMEFQGNLKCINEITA